jgi:hypothetical protein
MKTSGFAYARMAREADLPHRAKASRENANTSFDALDGDTTGTRMMIAMIRRSCRSETRPWPHPAVLGATWMPLGALESEAKASHASTRKALDIFAPIIISMSLHLHKDPGSPLSFPEKPRRDYGELRGTLGMREGCWRVLLNSAAAYSDMEQPGDDLA